MDWALVAFVVAVVLLASTAQTVAGFGFALIAVPFLVTGLEIRDVVVVTSALSLLNSMLVARVVWRHVPRRTVATMLAGSLAGMPAGLVVLLFAPAEALRIAVGVLSIVLAVMLVAGMTVGARGMRGELLAGVTSGVLNTSTSMNGAPVVLYLQDARYPPNEFRGALSAFFLVSGIVSLAAFAATGVVSVDALALAAVAAPAVFAGNALGHAMLGLVSDHVFRRIVLLLLIGTAGVSVATSVARLVA